MTVDQAKQFLKDELTTYFVGNPYIPGGIDGLLNNISPELDEAVHDLAGEFSTEHANQADESEADDIIGEGEDGASEINNGGLDSQLGFLCAHNDDEGMKKILLEAIHEAFKPDEFSDLVE